MPLVKELSFIKILVTKFLCRQPEHDAAIRTYDILAVFAAPTDILQISAASDSFHDWEHHHHSHSIVALGFGLKS